MELMVIAWMENQHRIQNAISFLMGLPEDELQALLKELGCDITDLDQQQDKNNWFSFLVNPQ